MLALRSLACFALLGALPTACNSAAPAPEGSQPAAAAAPVPVSSAKSFGAPLGKSRAAELSEILAHPEKYENQNVLVEGEVRRACSRKGCWMELSSSSAEAAPGCRVTFKDYAFFVPTDAAGSKARVEAMVQTSVVKARHVTHLEEEGAKFAEKAPDGTAREVRLVATGVELWR